VGAGEWAPAPTEPAKIAGVYVSLTRVDTSESPFEDATAVAEEMERWLREIDGFEGMLVLSQEGTSLGLTFWESRDVAERHRVARREFLERMTSVAAVRVEDVLEYEVDFAALGPALARFSARP
jgi:hypothetical protein